MNKLKGTLLEIIIRRIITACGFRTVSPDFIYVEQAGDGLQWVNGKGSRHDADVLLEPPFQLPFSFPTRIIVECKSYDEVRSIGLPIIRNAHGLRSDINDFEIITREHLELRRNNRRASLAIEQRNRFNYQVAVASISGFTKPAIEFAFNNKISLIDLTELIPNIQEIFRNINSDIIPNPAELLNDIRNGFHSNGDYPEPILTLARELEIIERNLIIGVLSSGDLLFLTSNLESKEILYNSQLANSKYGNSCTVHFETEEISNWYISCNWKNKEAKLKFNLPKEFFKTWASKNYTPETAIDLKEQYLKRMTLYTLYGDNIVLINMTVPDLWFDHMKKLLD